MALASTDTDGEIGGSGLLRVFTCGSVDDGKSTLIGRLLHDSKSVHDDQLDAVQKTSARRGDEHLDLSLLTDGLRAEREQGITIDVAYRYFSTPRRKFILADTPGHVQYTRNMATGASTADAAIILIDARQGVLEQTRRHACLAALLGVSHMVVCVNKMDLVGYESAVFARIRDEFLAFVASASSGENSGIFTHGETTFIPISALRGDNVVEASGRMPWYSGPALLEHLESVSAEPLVRFEGARFPVQWVIRPQSSQHHDYRGYAGQVASGELRVGDEVVALPGGQRSRIVRIHVGHEELSAARSPQSVALVLEDDLDIARGDLLVRRADLEGEPGIHPPAPVVTREINATVVWMSQRPLELSKRLLLKHATRSVAAIPTLIDHRLEIDTLERRRGVTELKLNEIGRASFRLGAPIVCDPYARSRATGCVILINEATNDTVGAGMIV